MKPRKPIHPGEMLLEEFLRPKGKRGVTADTALDLAKALGTSPELWMNLQMMWDLRRAELRRKAS